MSELFSLSNIQVVSSCRADSKSYFSCFLILNRVGVNTPLVSPVIFVQTSGFGSLWTIRSGIMQHRKFLGLYAVEFDAWFSENFKEICEQFIESVDTCQFGIKAVTSRYVAQDLCFKSIDENLELFSKAYERLAQHQRNKKPALKWI